MTHYDRPGGAGATTETPRAATRTSEGFVERDGVRVFYEVYGEGEPTVLLLPDVVDRPLAHLEDADPVPRAPLPRRHLRRPRQRALRPPARSRRPTREAEFAADALAVLDATETERACRRRPLAGRASGRCCSRAEHPERVAGHRLHRAGAAAARRRAARERRARRSTTSSTTYEGWEKFNRHYWLQRLPRTSSSSSSRRSSPSRTRPSRSRTASAGGSRRRRRRSIATPSSAPRLADDASVAGAAAARPLPGRSSSTATRRRDHARTTRGAALAELTGGDARRARGLGPRPARARPGAGQPAAARLRRARQRRPRRWRTRPRARRKRALYISSPIGLGHARRDVAIADELRKLHPDLEIDWLAQHPVTAVLEARGERIHPASAQLANESAHIESESAEHDLHCFQACGGWTRSCSRTSWSSTTSCATSSTTSGSATRPGSSTTTCTRTRS